MLNRCTLDLLFDPFELISTFVSLSASSLAHHLLICCLLVSGILWISAEPAAVRSWAARAFGVFCGLGLALIMTGLLAGVTP